MRWGQPLEDSRAAPEGADPGTDAHQRRMERRVHSRHFRARADDPGRFRRRRGAGSCVELRRGARIIIGRVMWAKQDRFGLSTQDKLDVESIIAGARWRRGGRRILAGRSRQPFDRRATVRPATAFERSRQWSRAFEFALHHDLRGGWVRGGVRRPSRNCSPHRWPRSNWDWDRCGAEPFLCLHGARLEEARGENFE